MLSSGRIPLEEAEDTAISKLLAEHPDQPASFSRRDPGESGPVIVQIGDEAWEIDADGRRKKLKAV